MFDEGKVGVFDTISLMTITITAKVFFLNTTNIAELCGPAGWIQTIVTGITVFVLFFITSTLMSRFEGNNLIEVYDNIFGTIITKVIVIILTAYFAIYLGFILREFVDILKTLTLPRTPISLTLIAFLLAIIIVCYKGFESLTRTAAFFALLILLSFLVVTFLPAPKFSFFRLFPVFGHGIGKIIFQGILYSSSYSELISLPILIKSFQGIKNFKKIGYWTILISTVSFFIASLSYSLVYPYTTTYLPNSALFALSRSIQYGRFFQRLESIFIIVWVISCLLNLGFGLYFMSYLFSKAYKLPDYKPILILFSILIYAFAILPPNISWISQIGIKTIRTYSIIPIFGTIMLALMLSIIKNKKSLNPNN